MAKKTGVHIQAIASAARAAALALPTLVFVQAVIAGRSNRLFGTWDIVTHGYVGNLAFLVAAVGLVLALIGRQRRQVVSGLALVVLIVAQIGLGYVGRTNVEAAVWHIPNGVAIFGLAVYNVGLYERRRGGRQP